MVRLHPAVIVHGLPDAHRALAPGLPVTLLSARGAALFAGCAFWRALVHQARIAHPHTPMQHVLDCADASGQALAALRLGQHIIVLDRGAPGREAVVDLAQRDGSDVLEEPPPALDLSRADRARASKHGFAVLTANAACATSLGCTIWNEQRSEPGGGGASLPSLPDHAPQLDLQTFPDLLAAALDAGDVAAVQLRLKDVDDATWHRAIAALRPVAQARDVAFLLNDRADLVRNTGCDGVHVGQEDMPAPQARALIGPDLTLGVTCKGSRDLALRAGENGADYVAFGAFYPSGSKAVSNTIPPDILRWWSDLMELPCCAIGGITAANCAPLVQAGADFLAVIAAVWNHPEGPAQGVRAINAAIAAAAE